MTDRELSVLRVIDAHRRLKRIDVQRYVDGRTDTPVKPIRDAIFHLFELGLVKSGYHAETGSFGRTYELTDLGRQTLQAEAAA